MEETLIQPAKNLYTIYTTSARSASINKLAEALAKAQSKFTSAPKNKINPHLKSKYADLASVLDTVREPLASNDLAFVQVVETDGAKIICYTDLMHVSDQWVRGKLVLHSAQTAIQQIGAAITYAKRYALSAMLGIASDEEDDGEAEQAATAKKTETNGKYKQISVSEPVPVAPKAAAKAAAKAEAKAAKSPEQAFVDKTQGIFPGSEVVAETKTDSPASDDLKGLLWSRCKMQWPEGTKDACEAAMKASKLPPINWKTATVSDCRALENMLIQMEANTGEGAPM